MKTYNQKMEQAVRVADQEVNVHTTNHQEVKIIKEAIRSAFGIIHCTKKMLDDFGTMRMRLASTLVQETSITESILKAIEQRPDTHGENPAFAKTLEEGSRILQSSYA